MRKICPKCGGAGTLHTQRGAYNRFKECKTCNGEGYIMGELNGE